MVVQRWGLVTLTDLSFREDGVRTYRCRGSTWYLVVRQKVGFLMSEVWWNWWQSGGAVVYQKSYRIAALSFPRVGWRRGLFVVGVYVPTSSSGKEERKSLRNFLHLVLEFTPTTTGEAHFCAPALSYVLRTKTGTFFVTLFSPISIALRPSRPASRPASKLAPKCFVLIPMVSRRWSSRLALRPASNYTSSSKLFVWLQFPYP